jgi:hypothetical protein
VPDPETLTVGEMLRAYEDYAKFEKIREQSSTRIPAIMDCLNRLDGLFLASPGIREFVHYANIELGRNPDEEARREFLGRLAKELHEGFEKIYPRPLLDAVRRLGHSGGTEAAAGPAPPPREDKRTAATPSGTALTPAARALAAACDLQREGKPISLRAACERSGVDRAHLREKYPEVAEAIKRMATPDRTPRRGTRDRRTGAIDAVDDPVDIDDLDDSED